MPQLRRPAGASRRQTRGDHGATGIEYALMASLVAVVIAGAVTVFGMTVQGLFAMPGGL